MLKSSFISSSRRSLVLLASAFAFLGIVFAVDRIVAMADFNYTVGSSLNDLPVYQRGADVLFIGDSRTHQGVDAVRFQNLISEQGHEVTAYNLARPAMQTPFMYLLSDRIFDSPTATKPKVIFVNLSFYLLGGQRGYLRDIYLSHVSPRWYEAVDLLSSGLISLGEAAEWMIKPHLPLWKHSSVVRNLAFRFAESPMSLPVTIRGETNFRLFQNDAANEGGFALGATQVEPDKIEFAYSAGNEEAPHIEYMRRFFENALNHDVEIIIYEFPWPDHPELNNSELMDIRTHYRDLILDQAAGMPNVHYVFEPNYWPVYLFADQQHLNKVGATRLTAYLADLYSRWAHGEEIGQTPSVAIIR